MNRNIFLIAILLAFSVLISFASGEEQEKKQPQKLVYVEEDEEPQEKEEEGEEEEEDNKVTEQHPPTLLDQHQEATAKKEEVAKQAAPLDEDEFEGFEQRREAKRAAQKAKEDVARRAFEERKRRIADRGYTVEIAIASVFAVYAAWLYFGKRANDAIARRFAVEFSAAESSIIRSNFTAVSKVIRDSLHSYTIEASGRVNLKGARFFLDLIRRQDPFMTLAGIALGWRDTLTVDASLVNSDPFVFVLCRRTELKKLSDERSDIPNLAKTTIRSSKVPDGFVAVTDAEEVAPAFLTDEVYRTVAKYSDLFVSLHITDRKTILPHNRMMRMVVYLPKNIEEMERLTTLLRMAMYIVDAASDLKLSKATNVHSMQMRFDLEVAEQKKQTPKKDEKKEMTPAEKEKKEEKERKKAMRPKVKIVH